MPISLLRGGGAEDPAQEVLTASRSCCKSSRQRGRAVLRRAPRATEDDRSDAGDSWPYDVPRAADGRRSVASASPPTFPDGRADFDAGATYCQKLQTSGVGVSRWADFKPERLRQYVSSGVPELRAAAFSSLETCILGPYTKCPPNHPAFLVEGFNRKQNVY